VGSPRRNGENGRIAWKLKDGKVGCVGSLNWAGWGRGQRGVNRQTERQDTEVVDIVA
jgi:hypothetical protein